MSRLASALQLAAEGFYVFPLKPGQKLPAFKGWQQSATRDSKQIKQWFANSDFNIGIFTGRFGDDEALLVVDVDVKGAKNGNAELLKLECAGFELPETRVHHSPSGGRHLILRTPAPVRSGVDVLAPGLDIRSGGGLVVGPGSRTKDGEYRSGGGDIGTAPVWLVERAGAMRPKRERVEKPADVDADRAIERATRYLKDEAPASIKGMGGDQTAYKVAARVKDFGVTADTALQLMLEHWNDRCPPGWSPERLWEKVSHAYEYGQEPPGVAAPEADFEPVYQEPKKPSDAVHPYDKLNQEFAFVLAGGGAHILWETTDAQAKWKLEHLALSAFHQKFAAQKIVIGKKEQPVTVQWMEWKGRRSFDGLVFMPQQTAPDRFYNLWRGFAVEPLPDDAHPTRQARAAFDAFMEHAEKNVCNGDAKLFNWLMGYFAHLVQRPWEKPLVALVFKGQKGVGKNALVETVGELLGGHFLLTSNKRYLTGNFNGHLENCLLLALDEAFWSGDKQAEGTLKDLITGKQHVIEHKGKEPYTVDNRTRVAIIGNEDWIVPSSHDERRFAVFDVGEGRKQDVVFFRAMREGMAAGGNRLLLRHLRALDHSMVDVNTAPRTRGLLDQKIESLELFPQWWLTCLQEGKIVGGDFAEAWPETVDCDQFRDAFGRYLRQRNIKSRMPSATSIGRQFKLCAPGHFKPKTAKGYVYKLPPLNAARADWDTFIGHEMEW